MKNNNDIIKKTAEALQLYFHFGTDLFFAPVNELLTDHFEALTEFDEDVLKVIEQMEKANERVDFIHLAYSLYKRSGIPKDFETGVRRCESIINRILKLRNNIPDKK